MRYYIAYKYSKNKNKDELKQKLEKFSQKINSWGHDTFILGRDVKKWKHIHLGSLKLIPVIYRNMKECHVLVAYVDSPSFSKGLLFEVLISKLLGLKSVMIVQGKRRSKFFKHLFNRTINTSNYNQLTPKQLS